MYIFGSGFTASIVSIHDIAHLESFFDAAKPARKTVHCDALPVY